MPGAYRSVCVELKLQHLAVNAIAQSPLLADLEHTAMSDDGAGVGGVFASLVKLVNAWLADATENGNMYGEQGVVWGGVGVLVCCSAYVCDGHPRTTTQNPYIWCLFPPLTSHTHSTSHPHPQT